LDLFPRNHENDSIFITERSKSFFFVFVLQKQNPTKLVLSANRLINRFREFGATSGFGIIIK